MQWDPAYESEPLTRIPKYHTVTPKPSSLATVDNIVPLGFVDDEVVDQARVEVGVGVD